MSINIKKHTKEQMARMVEEAQEKTAALEAEIAELKRKLAVQGNMIDQMNGEAINKANEIANLKADADDLRNKLADTEAALGRANAQTAQWIGDYDKVCIKAYNHYHRANYAEAHPFRNLWAWVKRKLGCKA